MFTLTPLTHINGQIPLNVLSGYLTGGDSRWSFLFNPVVTGSEYGSHLLGASFNRFDLNGRIVHSLLRYTGDHTTIQLGRVR